MRVDATVSIDGAIAGRLIQLQEFGRHLKISVDGILAEPEPFWIEIESNKEPREIVDDAVTAPKAGKLTIDTPEIMIAFDALIEYRRGSEEKTLKLELQITGDVDVKPRPKIA